MVKLARLLAAGALLTAGVMSIFWLNDPSSANRSSGRAVPRSYLSAADRCRDTRVRELRDLYEGRHAKHFLQEERTQWRYPVAKVQGRVLVPYVTVNMLRLVANTTADLLFGAPPRLTAPTRQQTDRIDELTRRSMVHARLHEAAVQMSWAGGAFMEASIWHGEVYVECIPPDEIFPQGRLMPDGQYESYVRYSTSTLSTEKVGDRMAKKRIMLETIYLPGEIRRRLRKLDDQGVAAGDELPLDQWPEFKSLSAADLPQPVMKTGLKMNTIAYFANKSGEQLGVSDFEGLIELQDEVNAKYVQVAIILDKHVHPKLRVPRLAADANGNFPSDAEVVFGDSPDGYGYITWDGQLEPALKDRAGAEDAFCVAAEMSPMLLGIRRGAAPESARKARLDATKDLARAGRKSLIVQPATARLIEVAQRLDQTTALQRSYPLDPPGVQMRDGLPKDAIEIAEEISLLRGGKPAMSLEAAVELRVEDPDAAFTEVNRIREEAKAAPDPFSFGSNTGDAEPGEDDELAAERSSADSGLEAA